MGWCLKGKRRCERDRRNKLLNEKRKEYPKITYDFESWKKVPPSLKLTQCKELGTNVELLRLLKAGKLDDSALSDGHRVDERGVSVYPELYNEFNTVYKRRYCDKVIDTDVQNKDLLESRRQADIIQARVEKDTEQQRTIIIAVGGVVLLLGTVLILRKL